MSATEPQQSDEQTVWPECPQPPFYGTSQVLAWDSGALSVLPECVAAGLDRFCADRTIVARGLYAFFPTITEKRDIIVLDPGDFSTERCVISAGVDRDGISPADFLCPDGDMIALLAASVRFDPSLSGPDDFSGAQALTDIVCTRLGREIRRALLVPQEQGTVVSFGSSGMPRAAESRQLFDVLALEERIDMILDSAGHLEPVSSDIAMFLHHPQSSSLQHSCAKETRS